MFSEEPREGGEALIDEDEIALVPVHEGGHGFVGIVVIDEEAGDDEVDLGEVEFLEAANERGGGGDAVFLELFLTKGEGGGGEIVDPDVAGVAAQDEGFGSDACPEDEDALAEEEIGVVREPLGEDAGGLPALVVVDVDSLFHFGNDFLFHPGVIQFHEGECFATDEVGLEKGGRHVFGGGSTGIKSWSFRLHLARKL